MDIKIAPSILSANFAAMGAAVRKIQISGADLIHCDVMDGSFVTPITFGAQMVKSLHALTDLPLDVHLMIEHPQTQVRPFVEAGASIITVHYSACKKISESYLEESLRLIKSYGVKCGVAINPDVPVENIFPLLPVMDMLLIMSVYPGYGGQKYISEATLKIKKAREYADKLGLAGLDIEVDGGINFETCIEAKEAGANVLVAGNTVFSADDMAWAINALRGNN